MSPPRDEQPGRFRLHWRDRSTLERVVKTGEVVLAVTQEWDADTHQAFLRMVRSHWRGWRIVLFEDKGPPHTAR